MSDEGMYCRSCGVWVEWSDWIIRKDNDHCPHCNGPLCNETELEAVKLLDATFDLESLPRYRPFIPQDGYQRPMNLWFITNEAGEFWNNNHDEWVSFDEATNFSDSDHDAYLQGGLHLPVGGRWERAQANNDPHLERLAKALSLREACKVALEALYNAPCVGEVYDQQHSDTHLKAIHAIQTALAFGDTV